MLSLGAPANAALSVVADYTFDDASALAPFTVNGDAAVVGGQLVVDGDGDWIEIADPLAGATDNFIYEAEFTPTGFQTIGFNLVTIRNPAGVNQGVGINIQGNPFGTSPEHIQLLSAGSNNADSGIDAFASSTYIVSIVRQNGVSSMYVNGTLSPNTSATLLGTPSLLTIGAGEIDGGNGNGEFIGSIDRVRLSTIGANDPLIVGQDGFLEVVPEPSSLALLGLGGLVIARRRR